MENIIKAAKSEAVKRAETSPVGTEGFSAQTDKNIAAGSQAPDRARQSLLKILSDYDVLAARARAEQDQNLADAAILSAKAAVKALKSELSYALGGEKTSYEAGFDEREAAALREKNSRADSYSRLVREGLSKKIREAANG